jgi:hypothetical protein
LPGIELVAFVIDVVSAAVGNPFGCGSAERSDRRYGNFICWRIYREPNHPKAVRPITELDVVLGSSSGGNKCQWYQPAAPQFPGDIVDSKSNLLSTVGY